METKMKIVSSGALLVILLLFTFTLLQGCGNHAEEEHGHEAEAIEQEEHSSHEEEEIVRLSAKELEEFGVELAIAGPGKLQVHTDLTGEIVIDPDRLAHIIPRFPGIVKEVRKKTGDKVKKGQVLAIIESNESLVPYEVKSLIDGTVIEMHLTLGEVISDATHAFIVADLSYVWANLSVYQKDLQFIKIGQKAVITSGSEMPDAQGKVSYISPVVEEDTRTATARVVLHNPDGRWRPGLFISATVIKQESQVDIIIPKTALETFEERRVVFVKTEEGFIPQPVSVGRSNNLTVEIIAGLHPGQEYVSKGGFTIKTELQKEGFGGGHGH